MRFMVVAHLPPALARILSAKGCEAEHVFDMALGTADDSAVWQHSIDTQAVIITKDEDFASMVTLRTLSLPSYKFALAIRVNANCLLGLCCIG